MYAHMGREVKFIENMLNEDSKQTIENLEKAKTLLENITQGVNLDEESNTLFYEFLRIFKLKKQEKEMLEVILYFNLILESIKRCSSRVY